MAETAEGEGTPTTTQGSTFDYAKTLLESGKKPAEVKQALIAERGLDEESARVLVNSLPGAQLPTALPEANVSLTTNALAPDLFSFGELGLSGDAPTVGQYWLVFSGVLLVVMLLVMFVPVPELFGAEGPSDSFLYFMDNVLPPVGFTIVGVTFARGLFLVVSGRRFKFARRSK